jgi:predicted TIM-barrel fold metal-dependent hydrolase
MSIFDLPKIDGHCHVLDPQRFAYPAEVAYHPQGQEVGTAAYFAHVMDAYAVRHALLVGPNSGYGYDNRCLLDAIAQAPHRFKGVAVVPADTSTPALRALQSQGIVGIAFNPSFHGLDHYHDIDGLLQRLADLGMWAQFQVNADQLVALLPRILRVPVRTMIDHVGRPRLADGPQAPGLQALARLADSGQAVIKISGFVKFSEQPFPFDDAKAPAQRVWQMFGAERCIWASDWPYLRASARLDYGPMLKLIERWFSPAQCQQMMWDNPQRLFDW